MHRPDPRTHAAPRFPIGRLRRVPFLRVLLLTAFLYSVGEFYPFSNFPMYSGLDDDVEYFYIRRTGGDPVPMLSAYGIRTARAKKIYNSELADLAAKEGRKRSQATTREQEKAGHHLLEYLTARMSGGQREIYPSSGIELVRVVVVMRDGRFERTEQTVAALSAAKGEE